MRRGLLFYFSIQQKRRAIKAKPCPKSATAPLGGDSGEAERGSGIGLKLFGFIAESVFALRPGILFGLNPECCSELLRNYVHVRSDLV